MRTFGTEYWLGINQDGTNSSGLSAVPGGYRKNLGTFEAINSYAWWWTATNYDNDNGWTRSLINVNSGLGVDPGQKNNGFSIRCVKD
jgi:uncharacterized protein (TIGR02145 family)